MIDCHLETDEQNNVKYLVSEGRDITERKHAEDEVKQRNDDLKKVKILDATVT